MPTLLQVHKSRPVVCLKAILLLVCLFAYPSKTLFALESPDTGPSAILPDAPLPVTAGLEVQSTQQPAQTAATQSTERHCEFPPCYQSKNWYARFANGPQVTPLSPAQKGWLAARNFLDPFNAITILGEGGISIGIDSHTAYGPGMPGFGRYVGVSFTQDLTGEFFNTFLIPSIAHQDPHYHRMPHASYPRRVVHTVAQVIWTHGDDGKGMLNYANLVGFAVTDMVGNLYVPGRQTSAGATAQRYAIGLATAPIGNIITEFLPDVARRIHVQIVLVQRIVNHVAANGSGQ